jgi:hypothetical protein
MVSIEDIKELPLAKRVEWLVAYANKSYGVDEDDKCRYIWSAGTVCRNI